MDQRKGKRTEQIGEIAGRLLRIEKLIARVYFMAGGLCYLCDCTVDRIEVLVMSEREIRDRIIDGTAEIIEEEPEPVVEFSQMKESLLKTYEENVRFIQQIEIAFGPTYTELKHSMKTTGKKMSEIMEAFGITKTNGWKLIRRFLQGGCSYTALIDRRATRGECEEYNYTKKTGRSEYADLGVVLDAEVKKQFEKYRQWRLKSPNRTWKQAYLEMCKEFYSRTGPKGESYLLPLSERPTDNQFKYYCRNHTTKEEITVAKLGATEARNAERLLTGESKTGVDMVGQIMECDALEADVSLLSQDRKHTIGRAVLYLGVDVLTTAITAFSVGFKNNCYEGVSSMFMSLALDKEEMMRKYGIDDFREDDIPDHYIPAAARCDNGPEFQGGDFKTFCRRAKIREESVPPRSGSLKGIVESRFRLLHKDLRPLLEGMGLITKDYGSKHHEEAKLTIEEFTKLALIFIIHHNRNIPRDYEMSPEQIAEGIEASPKELWKYYEEKTGCPKKITERNRNSYLSSILVSARASISKTGVRFKGLSYINKDSDLLELMRAEGGRVRKMDIRYDPSDCSVLYYLHENTLKVLYLNMDVQGSASFAGMTFREVDFYKKLERELKKAAKEKNLINDFERNEQQKDVIRNAPERPEDAGTDNMKEHRRAEKERVDHETSVTKEIFHGAQVQLSDPKPADAPGEDLSDFIPCGSIDEAIETMYEPKSSVEKK